MLECSSAYGILNLKLRTFGLHLLSFLFVSCLLAEESTDYLESLGSFADKPFRSRMDVHVLLDGSEEAGSLQGESQTSDVIVYLSHDQWRAKRQLPLRHSQKEILHADGEYFQMSPTNVRALMDQEIPASFWAEVPLSILRLARAWALADSDETLPELMAKLSKAPLQNAEGDRIALTDTTKKGTYTVSYRGSLRDDSKTKIQIDGQWELTFLDPKDAGSEPESWLMRSL